MASRPAIGELFPEAQDVLDRAIASRAFPGCAFGVLQASDKGAPVIISGASGHFTYDPDSTLVYADTLYDVASLTKVMATTAVAMLLYQKGRLELDALLGDILPAFVVGREDSRRARRVTLRHLLAHSSGLPGYVPIFLHATSPADLLRACLSLPIEAEPGSRAEYSDPGFILLGKALETILHEDLATFLHREVYLPLGMDHTTFCPPPSCRNQIPPTEEDELFRQRTIQGEVQDEHAHLMGGKAGHAGLFSTVPDCLRFASSVLHLGSQSLLLDETIQTFSQRQPPAGSSRALGWDTPSENSSSGTLFSEETIGHLGYSGCSLWIDREAKLAIALLTNRTWPDRSSQEIRSVRPAFHDAIRKAL